MRLELTKRADYAIRAVLALGEAGPDILLSARRIATDRGIPRHFLRQVMADLVAAGVVDGQEGRAGGYRLARPAAAVSLLEVIEAVEGDGRRRDCVLRGGPCRLSGVCDVHEVFAAAQDDVLRHLGSASVASVVGHEARDSVGAAPRGGRQVRE